MGAASSGAMDAHGFAAAVRSGSGGACMPDVDTLTYQGVFNEHFFDVGAQEEKRAVAAQCFPIVQSGEKWLAIFLKSAMDGKPRDGAPIDLSVVIDISGSMNGRMAHGNQVGGSRLDHAKRAVSWLVKEVLRDNDSIAVSTFNNQGYPVQPLTRCEGMDCESFLLPVEDLKAGGGTILAAGMQIGRDSFGNDLSEIRHRRILFLTDMGEMNATELGNMIKQNADDGVYVSIVAMGAEFNSALTETVTKNRGSNYFCATNESELHECLIDDFDFHMFPAAFDIDLAVNSGKLGVVGVYGTPFDTTEVQDLVRKWTPQSNAFYKEDHRKVASHLLMYSHSIRRPLPVGVIGHVIDFLEPPVTSITEVNTMFPSRIAETGSMKGGMILIRFQHQGKSTTEQPVQVKLTYTDNVGCAFTQLDTVVMPGGTQDFIDAQYKETLSKGLLLQHYVQVCREHMKIANSHSVESTADKSAALPGLVADLNKFKSRVETQFHDDGKMNEVVSNYNDFVTVFTKSANSSMD